MERRISGFHQDAEGVWVAELDCGHDQHVRHQPPFEQRAWVLSASERSARLGTARECPLCDRAELPGRATLVRSSPTWDERSLPQGLRTRHRLRDASWGLLRVEQGQLRYRVQGSPELTLVAGTTQAIPPGVEHAVDPVGAVRLRIDFFTVPRRERTGATADLDGPGGEAACFAHLVCADCGAALDGSGHRPGCPAGHGAR